LQLLPPAPITTKQALYQLHIAVFLWGFTGVLGRAISVDEYALVIYRMVLTTAILGLVLYSKKELFLLPWAEAKKLIGIGCIIAIHWVAFYGSIKKANASIALICLSTSSIYTAILIPFLQRKKIIYYEIIASIIAVLGMVLIYRFETKYVTGIIFGLLAAMLSAVFTTFNKKIINNYSSQLIAFYEIGGGVVLLIVLAPLYHYYFPQLSIMPTSLDYLWLLLLSYFCTVLGQSLALSALKKLSAFTVVLAVNLEPIYGIVLAFLLYQEDKDLSKGFYYGIAIIAFSVLFHSWMMYWQSLQNKKA
jgi:drug/metabolite transporter (DMT)-like permease